MNFYELNSFLSEVNIGNRASECHGFICGYLCINQALGAGEFMEYLQTEITDNDTLTRCNNRISSLVDEVIEELASEDMLLALYLPDENRSLVERSESFIQWCEGFLSGLVNGGLKEFELLSTESQEVIQDMYKICRLDVDRIRGTDDSEESAFMELTEYVRMGVLMLHGELHQHRDTSTPEVIH